MTTTILEQRQTSLNVGFASPSGASAPRKNVTSKPAFGSSGPGARLALLPTQKSRMGFVGVSMGVQLAILAIILLIPLAFPQKFLPKMNFDVMNIAAPRTEVPVPEKPKPVAPKQRPLPVQQAKVIPPVQPLQPKLIVPHVVAPKVQPKPIEKAEAPKISAPVFESPKVDIPVTQPAQPKKPIETGSFNSGSAAPATLPNKTAAQVQTGGFGDPNGMPGPANPNKRGNINTSGQFNLPSGPGYGNGTGGAKGARGTVASSGFGNGTAIDPTTGGKGGQHGTIQSGGFSTAAVDADQPKAKQQQQQSAVQPVEILEKPQPDYSAEARSLKIEGEVLLSVVFKANGQIQVLGVTKGLGHGLDESAIRAAQKIRYKPALSSGQAVDFPATVHIVFQLAY
jgi:TonB family protein